MNELNINVNVFRSLAAVRDIATAARDMHVSPKVHEGRTIHTENSSGSTNNH